VLSNTIVGGLGSAGVNGGLFVFNGGVASAATVHGSSYVVVLSGGRTVSDLLIGSGFGGSAFEFISNGGVASARRCPTPAF